MQSLARSDRAANRCVLLVLVAIPWLTTSQAVADPPAIDDIKWIHEDADLFAALTEVRAECVMETADADRLHGIRLGRVAFRSPVLLGGLAARVGMSCNSCHPNGHDNPAFFVVGVSGEPGTADVTGSVFSTARDDRIFNPVPIPSLVDAAAQPTFGTVLTHADLATFLNAAIVDEFQGQSPPKSVADALFVYVTSLRASACPDAAMIAVSFETDARELRETLDLVLASLDRKDVRAADFVIHSLRAALGRVYRRFPETVAAREELIELSRSLADAQRRLESESGRSAARSALSSLREHLDASIQKLAKDVARSFYDAGELRRSLGLGS